MDLDKMKQKWQTHEGSADQTKDLSGETIRQYISSRSKDVSSGIYTMSIITIVAMIALMGFFTFGILSFYQNLLMVFICGTLLAFSGINLYLSLRLYQRLQRTEEDPDLRTAIQQKIEIIRENFRQTFAFTYLFGILVYAGGSMLYHQIKYHDAFHMFRDLQDTVVFFVFLVIGLILPPILMRNSLRSRIRPLQEYLRMIDNGDTYDTIPKANYRIFIWFAILLLGLVLFYFLASKFT